MLFDMTEQFIQRFLKESGDLAHAFERIGSLVEASKDALSSLEYKAIKIITKYLKAEKMTKK